jgi:hypothetical protein
VGARPANSQSLPPAGVSRTPPQPLRGAGPAAAAGSGAGTAIQRRAPSASRTARDTRRWTAFGSAKRTSHFAGCTFTSTAWGGRSTKSTADGKRPRGSTSR